MQAETMPHPPRLEKPVPITEQVWPEGTMPVVSVFSWAYNHAEFIRESIDSILMQETTFPVEVIIHDDASTDGTTEIIREYEVKYPHLFRNILQTKNQWSQGKNVMAPLLEAPSGEFVAITHGDDFWTDPLKLEKQVNLLRRNPGASGCYHAASVVNDSGELLEIRPSAPVPQQLNFEDIVLYNYILTCSLCYRSNYIRNDLPFLLRFSVGDWPLQVCLSTKGPLIGLDDNMGCYRRHSGGVWTQQSRTQELLAIHRFYITLRESSEVCLPHDFYKRHEDHLRECVINAWREKKIWQLAGYVKLLVVVRFWRIFARRSI